MSDNSETGRRHYSTTTMLLVVAVPVGLLTAIAWIPLLLVHLDTAGRRLDTFQQVQASGQARQMVLQAIGGLAVLLGAYVAYRRLGVNEAELQVSRDGQVTERFTRAVEHLGSGSADVRIGGIHALDRISRNSPGDREAVVAILSAFVRGRSPRSAPDKKPSPTMEYFPTLSTRAPDVQAAISALGRIPRTPDEGMPRLPFTDLRRARMWGLNLDMAIFSAATLQGARLGGSSMVEADLGHCDLREADLSGANLTGAQLWSADFTDAILNERVVRRFMSVMTLALG